MKLQVAFNFQSQSSLVLFNSAVTVYRQHYGPCLRCFHGNSYQCHFLHEMIQKDVNAEISY